MSPVNPRPTARKAKSNKKFSNDVPPGLHYLPPLDPRWEEFVELFRSFLFSKDERANILALAEPDARLFIELIDRAFRASPLDNELRQVALGVLRELSNRTGHLPESYLLSDKFDISGKVVASGGFADVRKGMFKGKNVAVKTLKVLPTDDKAKIRRHFCREVAMWKNLSHPNVLALIGVPDTLDEGRFSMVSEWMANGNIVAYVRNNAGNHLQLLAGAVEGLGYLHKANIVHGDLKGANILIANTNPISACLADFGFTTIVYDPSLEMESPKSAVAGGTTPFMAPELLVPSRFGLEKCAPTKGADVYAMAMAIYQVLTGSLPYGKLGGSEVIFKVLGGQKPLKPANAIELGLSDRVWRLLEHCWKTDSASRPSVKEVSACIKSAASACGILSPAGDTPQQHEDPDSDLFKFDHLFADDDGPGATPMGRPPSEGSTLTDISLPDSLFSSNVSEAASPITQGEGTWSGTFTSREGGAYPKDPSAVGNLGASSSVLLPDRTTIGRVQGRDGPTRQLCKPPGMFTLFSPKPRPIEANIDGRVKQKHRQSRFHIRRPWLRIIPPEEANM